MKEIKLSGRERAVVRAIDFATGSTGEELLERTHIEPEDLVDVLNALIGLGYAETAPYSEATSLEDLQTTLFELNPSYALALRAAIAHL